MCSSDDARTQLQWDLWKSVLKNECSLPIESCIGNHDIWGWHRRHAHTRGDEATAYSIYYPVCAIVSLQLQAGLDGFLAIEKHLMVKRGLFPSARRRRPYGWDLDPETAAEVDRLFERLRVALSGS